MASSDPDGYDNDARPSSGWGRMKASISNFMLKSAVNNETAPSKKEDTGPTTVPEIEAKIKRADDKERAVGLLAAPIAAAIGLLVTGALLAHDPKEVTKHVAPSLYVELGAVTLVLALAMLGAAWFRKRTFLGIAMALYGLSIFNLHYWGFGLPYIFGGAWYLVRSYRLSEKLKFAKAAEGGGPATATRLGPARPQQSKRYTPPAAPARPPAKPKRGKELEAG
jgi:hypothetical protein